MVARVFGLPFNQKLIGPFLDKSDRISQATDRTGKANCATGIPVSIAGDLGRLGVNAIPLSMSKVYPDHVQELLYYIEQPHLRTTG